MGKEDKSFQWRRSTPATIIVESGAVPMSKDLADALLRVHRYAEGQNAAVDEPMPCLTREESGRG